MARREREYLSDDDKRTLIKRGILGLIVFVVIGILFAASYEIGPGYQYRREIGAHIDNAFDASTFEVMKDNLLRARAGMVASGLTDSDCGRAMYWEQTPDMCMAYTYQYLDGLVTRAQYYIDTFKANNTSQFTDVYTNAINNMRAEMHRNGPVDWAAGPAWQLEHAGLYYWGSLVYGLLAFGAIFSLAHPTLRIMREDW